jgi:CubicO group peptidase (beta-lactamase class C family)
MKTLVSPALALAFCVVLFASPTVAFDTTGVNSTERLSALESRLVDILAENQTPGLIAAVVSDQKIIWQGAIGITDIESQQPVGVDSLFRVGSISKTFVSLAVMQLVERGQLSLDQPVHDMIPEALIENPWRSSDPIRLVHLLEHTAGLDDIHFRDYVFSDPEVSTLEGILFNNGSRQARWRPGSRFSYSNMGPPLAALMIEKVTGKSFEEYVDSELLDALHMDSATFYYDEKVVSSYAADGKNLQPYVHIPVRSSGALNASSGDMIQLLRMLIGRGKLDGKRILQESSVVRVESPRSSLAARNGLQAGYGLSNSYEQSQGFVFHGHDGGIDGFLSSYAYLPDAGRGYFFSLNAGNGSAYAAIGDELKSFLLAGLEKPEAVAVIESAEFASDWSGFYEPYSPRAEFGKGLEKLFGLSRVKFEGNRLLLSPIFGDEIELLAVTDNMFIKQGDALPSLMLLTSKAGETVLQGRGGTVRQISSHWAYLKIGLLAMVGLMIASSIIYAPLWLIARLLGRPSKINYLRVRLLPLLTIVCLVSSVVWLSSADLTEVGTFSIASVAYWGLSILWAAMALISVALILQYRSRRMEVGVLVWWHSLLVSVALSIAAGYLSYYGLIGIRLWAY